MPYGCIRAGQLAEVSRACKPAQWSPKRRRRNDARAAKETTPRSAKGSASETNGGDYQNQPADTIRGTRPAVGNIYPFTRRKSSGSRR